MIAAKIVVLLALFIFFGATMLIYQQAVDLGAERKEVRRVATSLFVQLLTMLVLVGCILLGA